MEDMLGTLGTYWEPDENPLEVEGNIVETHWEPRENEKTSPSPTALPPNLKGKNERHRECMLVPSHWLHEFLFPKEFVANFGLGYHACKEHPTYSDLWSQTNILQFPLWKNKHCFMYLYVGHKITTKMKNWFCHKRFYPKIMCYMKSS
jgi:hypothetical protein